MQGKVRVAIWKPRSLKSLPSSLLCGDGGWHRSPPQGELVPWWLLCPSSTPWQGVCWVSRPCAGQSSVQQDLVFLPAVTSALASILGKSLLRFPFFQLWGW